MNIFKRAVSFLTGLFSKKNIKDVFGVEAFAITDRMIANQKLYRQIVRGKAPWNDDKTPSLKLAGSISAEVARKVTVGLESDIFGGEVEVVNESGKTFRQKTTNPRAEYLNEQYTKFKENLRAAVIAACNGGEIIFKPYMALNGLEVTVSETDCYMPVAYNARDELIDVIFAASLQREKWLYKLLERHTYDEAAQTHTITYRAFESEQSERGFTQDKIGDPIPVSVVPEWAHLEDIIIHGVEQSLFAPFKMPSSDTVETPQRQGLPIWSKAISKFEEADIQNRYIRREYYLGKARILASADLFGTSEKAAPPSTTRKPGNRPPIEFAPDDRDIFVKLDDDPHGGSVLTTFTPDLRFDSLNDEMNRIKRDIEFVCGLSYGIVSDPQIQERTATEILSSKDRFFTTVSDVQAALEKALRHVISSFDVLADLQDISQGDYEVSFMWDDSIMADRPREFQERKEAQDKGWIEPYKNYAWFNGVDDAAAEAAVAAMQTQQTQTQEQTEDAKQ